MSQAHRGRQHDPGHVVAGEDVGPLDQPGRDHQDLRARLDELLGSAREIPGKTTEHHRGPVAVVTARHHRVGEHLDPRRGRDLVPQLRQRGQGGAVAPAQVAAEPVLLLDQHDPRAGLRGGHGGGHPGRPAAGHQHVGVGKALVDGGPRRVRGHLPRVHEPLQHALVQRPQPLRLDEGLVVEAGAEEPAGQLVDRLDVEAQGRPGVLGTHVHGRFGLPVRAAHVRFVADLEEAPGVVEVRGEQAARPVVLVAAREHPEPGRRQRRRDRVPVERRDGAAVPAERERPLAVDLLARLRAQPHRAAHCAAHWGFPGGIDSLVSVSRWSTKNWRQPIRWYQVSVTSPRGLAGKYR